MGQEDRSHMLTLHTHAPTMVHPYDVTPPWYTPYHAPGPHLIRLHAWVTEGLSCTFTWQEEDSHNDGNN